MRKFFALLCFFTFFVVAADENFKWTLQNGRILLEVAKDCYLYMDSVKISAVDAGNNELQIILPESVKYKDEFSGEVQIIPAGKYTLADRLDSAVAGAKISYQGCKSAVGGSEGICFMPQDITLGNVLAEEETNLQKAVFLDDFSTVRKREGTMSAEEMLTFLDTSDTLMAESQTAWWEGKSFLWVLFLLLLGGFLLNFTPCVLPMIPINLAIIGAGGEKTPFAGFLRGAYYAIGMTCAYGILGLTVIFSGARFGELNSNMYFNFAIAVIFFALALAMAGVWNLDFSAKLNSINPMKWKIGRPLAIFLMGATAALLSGACVAPAVIGMILLAVSLYKTFPAAGIAVPFVFGAGMGVLWMIAGATMGKILPKPGKWMVYVKNIFAVCIGLFGIYYAFVGISLIPGKFNAEQEVKKLETALKEAAANDQKVFIDFWASWCKNCLYMDKNVLTDPQVKNELSKFRVIKFQAEDMKDPSVAEILKHYNIQGLPAFVIIERKNK